jgi:hypothetical protein
MTIGGIESDESSVLGSAGEVLLCTLADYLFGRLLEFEIKRRPDSEASCAEIEIGIPGLELIEDRKNKMRGDNLVAPGLYFGERVACGSLSVLVSVDKAESVHT